MPCRVNRAFSCSEAIEQGRRYSSSTRSESTATHDWTAFETIKHDCNAACNPLHRTRRHVDNSHAPADDSSQIGRVEARNRTPPASKNAGEKQSPHVSWISTCASETAAAMSNHLQSQPSDVAARAVQCRLPCRGEVSTPGRMALRRHHRDPGINVFLYQVMPNAYRNVDLPRAGPMDN